MAALMRIHVKFPDGKEITVKVPAGSRVEDLAIQIAHAMGLGLVPDFVEHPRRVQEGDNPPYEAILSAETTLMLCHVPTQATDLQAWSDVHEAWMKIERHPDNSLAAVWEACMDPDEGREHAVDLRVLKFRSVPRDQGLEKVALNVGEFPKCAPVCWSSRRGKALLETHPDLEDRPARLVSSALQAIQKFRLLAGGTQLNYDLSLDVYGIEDDTIVYVARWCMGSWER